MSVPPPHTLEELVDVVLAAAARHDDAALTIAHLSEQFGLSPADAELARDRALGGAVRAAAGNPANRPPRSSIRSRGSASSDAFASQTSSRRSTRSVCRVRLRIPSTRLSLPTGACS